MATTVRHREFIADLHAQRSRLGEPQQMRIGRLTSADKAGLRGNILQVRFVAKPFGFGDRKAALVDLSRRHSGRRWRKGRASDDSRSDWRFRSWKCSAAGFRLRMKSETNGGIGSWERGGQRPPRKLRKRGRLARNSFS
jgi:hypothetical protein